jgi:hypothetical protein
MFFSSDRMYRRLADDKRLCAKDRIAALLKVQRPSLSLLRRLLHPDSPPKLRVAASRLYEIAIARRNLNAKGT